MEYWFLVFVRDDHESRFLVHAENEREACEKIDIPGKIKEAQHLRWLDVQNMLGAFIPQSVGLLTYAHGPVMIHRGSILFSLWPW